MPEWSYRRIETAANDVGIPPAVIAAFMILVGVLVIVFPELVAWFVGIALIVLGILWIANVSRASAPAQPSSPQTHGEPRHLPPDRD